MKVYILEFDEGMAAVIHNNEHAAISLLQANYGSLPDIVYKYGINIGDEPPRILSIRGSVVISQSTLIAQRTKEVTSDVYDFKSRAPTIEVGEQNYETSPPEPPTNSAFDDF